MSAQGAWGSDVISVEGLCMRYRTLDVLRDVAFRVHRGEVVVLLGPNGASKTTAVGDGGQHAGDQANAVLWRIPAGWQPVESDREGVH
jgi:ABC-2 type transport system ATP-binding protein